MNNNRFILERLIKGTDSPTYKNIGEFPNTAHIGFALKVSRQSLDYKLKISNEFIVRGKNYRILDKVALYDKTQLIVNPFNNVPTAKVDDKIIYDGWMLLNDEYTHLSLSSDGDTVKTYVNGEEIKNK